MGWSKNRDKKGAYVKHDKEDEVPKCRTREKSEGWGGGLVQIINGGTSALTLVVILISYDDQKLKHYYSYKTATTKRCTLGWQIHGLLHLNISSPLELTKFRRRICYLCNHFYIATDRLSSLQDTSAFSHGRLAGTFSPAIIGFCLSLNKYLPNVSVISLFTSKETFTLFASFLFIYRKFLQSVSR